MARWRNLRDPVIPDTNRRVRDLEAGSPIGFSSVERGGLRIASDQGLIVEGQALVTGTLSGNGSYIWEGPSNISGPMTISGNMDISGNADFTGTVDARYFRVTNTGTVVVLAEDGVAVSKPGSGQSRVSHNDIYIGSSGNYAQLTPGGAKIVGIDDASSPTSHDILLIDSDGNILRGPKYSPGSGGPGGGVGEGDLIWPFSLDLVTSDYGWRTHPVTGEPETFHEGVDFGMWPVTFGTPVPCSGDGVVTRTDVWGGWGMSVSVDHGGGIGTQYNHLEGYAVNVGDIVSQGDIIGYVGSTGTSTGAHLDFNVLVDGHVNPVGSPRANPHDYVGLG